MDHHPLHLHGHTFWVTGSEGGRIPEPAWVPSNNVLVGVAQVREVEFIANNPGDWILHCHMFHHMMNSMTSQAGPIIRQFGEASKMSVKGYPQNMLGMEMGDMKMDGMKMEGMNSMPSQESQQPNPYARDMSGMGRSKVDGKQPACDRAGRWVSKAFQPCCVYCRQLCTTN